MKLRWKKHNESRKGMLRRMMEFYNKIKSKIKQKNGNEHWWCKHVDFCYNKKQRILD